MTLQAELILKGGTLVNHDGTGQRDIAVSGGRITGIGSFGREQAGTVIDCRGLHILPGVVDSQVHLREPGAEHKEDLETGGRAAVQGGVTAIFEMPNTNPLTTSAETLEDKIRRATNRMQCDFAFYMGGTRDNAHMLGDLEMLPGCAGVKVFMGSSTGSLLVEDDKGVARILANIRRRAAFHSEDEYRLNERKNLRVEGDPSSHPVWRDVEAARLSTERLIRLAREAHKRIHVLHISTADEFPLLAAARDVATVEVLANHLVFTSEDYARLGSLIQMNPRTASQGWHLGRSPFGPRRCAGLGPCAAYAGGEGQALSAFAVRHAGRADAGAGDARLREPGSALARALRRSHLAWAEPHLRHGGQGPDRGGL
jgi:dihydroorotase